MDHGHQDITKFAVFYRGHGIPKNLEPYQIIIGPISPEEWVLFEGRLLDSWDEAEHQRQQLDGKGYSTSIGPVVIQRPTKLEELVSYD